MKMTQKLANDLLDCFAAMAISANGFCPGTEEEIKSCEYYAWNTFLRLCDEWEKKKSERWEIIFNDKEEE